MTPEIIMNWEDMSEKEILIHIVGKIDGLLEKDEQHDECLKDHEGRIRKNEQWRFRTAALGGGGATILVGIVLGVMKAAGWIG